MHQDLHGCGFTFSTSLESCALLSRLASSRLCSEALVRLPVRHVNEVACLSTLCTKEASPLKSLRFEDSEMYQSVLDEDVEVKCKLNMFHGSGCQDRLFQA